MDFSIAQCININIITTTLRRTHLQARFKILPLPQYLQNYLTGNTSQTSRHIMFQIQFKSYVTTNIIKHWRNVIHQTFSGTL